MKPLKKIKRLDDLLDYDKEGKRRLALAELGCWRPTEKMNETDQERFKRHSREKIEKLKNPNISVSDKRIVLKYLDKEVTEQQIKETTHEFLSVNNLPPKQLTYVPHHLLSAN